MPVFLIVILTVFLLAALWLFAVAPAKHHKSVDNKMKVPLYAHRGLHGEKDCPENSLAAFKKAQENGFGIELDVRLTHDGETVVMHDDEITRVTGKNGKISEMTQAETEKLRLLGTDERVPGFSEVLEAIDGAVPLLIELKPTGGNYRELCQKSFSLLDSYRGDFVVESFDPRVLMWLKKNRPAVVRGQLAAASAGPDSKLLGFLLTRLMFNFLSRPHFIAYEADYIGKSAALNLCRRLYGTRLYVWTVRDKKQCDAFLSDHVGVIFENFLP